MARRLSHVFFALFLPASLVSAGCTAGHCGKKQPIPGGHVALFVFGDSYVDSGNNNYIDCATEDKADFWPYGETYFNFPTGRFSDGRQIPDFIAEYASLPFLPPLLQPGIEYYNGVNFASGGAGYLVETYDEDHVITIREQLRNYEKVTRWLKHKLGEDEGTRMISNAVQVISLGSNDYLYRLIFNTSDMLYPNSDFVAMVIGNLTNIFQQMYELGSRKIAIMNLPELGCLPATRLPDDSCVEELNEVTRMHNEALARALSELVNDLEGFKYTILDMHGHIQEVMDHPLKHGFKVGKSACCGEGKYRGLYNCGGMVEPDKGYELCENPSDYVFWDAYHNTEHYYKQFTDELWNADGNVTRCIGPYSLKHLFQIQQVEQEESKGGGILSVASS